jgi:ATP-dependent DNA helicase RecG
LNSKGKGKATYYVAGKELSTQAPLVSTRPPLVSTQPPLVSTQPPLVSTQPEIEEIPQWLLEKIGEIKAKEHDSDKVSDLIKEICSLRAMTAHEIAKLFKKREDYMRRKYLNKMIAGKQLKYLHAKMINHPEQAYITSNRP